LPLPHEDILINGVGCVMRVLDDDEHAGIAGRAAHHPYNSEWKHSKVARSAAAASMVLAFQRRGIVHSVRTRPEFA
jgi:hypothetical protein